MRHRTSRVIKILAVSGLLFAHNNSQAQVDASNPADFTIEGYPQPQLEDIKMPPVTDLPDRRSLGFDPSAEILKLLDDPLALTDLDTRGLPVTIDGMMPLSPTD